jgi:hypothetical protein
VTLIWEMIWTCAKESPISLINCVTRLLRGAYDHSTLESELFFKGKTHGVDSVCTVIVVVDYTKLPAVEGFLGADECSQPNTIENSGGDRTHRGIESLCWKERSKKGRFVWCYYYGKRRVIRIGQMTTRRDDHLDWLFVSLFLLPPTNSGRSLTFSSFKILLSFSWHKNNSKNHTQGDVKVLSTFWDFSFETLEASVPRPDEKSRLCCTIFSF